jgi:hypothetical protein
MSPFAQAPLARLLLILTNFKGRLHPNTDRIRGSVRMKIGPGLNVARGDVGGTFGMDRDTQPPALLAEIIGRSPT